MTMRIWKLKRWIRIKLGLDCARCHAELKLVHGCGICGRGGMPIQTYRAQPPRMKRVTFQDGELKENDERA